MRWKKRTGNSQTISASPPPTSNAPSPVMLAPDAAAPAAAATSAAAASAPAPSTVVTPISTAAKVKKSNEELLLEISQSAKDPSKPTEQLRLSKVLRERGVALDATDEQGRQAIHHACRKGHLSVVQWLGAEGVELDVPTANANRWHPLHYACSNGHLDIVQWLFEEGLPLDRLIGGGATSPLSFAFAQRHTATRTGDAAEAARHEAVLSYLMEKTCRHIEMKGEVMSVCEGLNTQQLARGFDGEVEELRAMLQLRTGDQSSRRVVAPLVDTLKKGRMVEQAKAAKELQQLIRTSPSYRDTIAAAGAITPLVGLIRSTGNSEFKITAVGALGFLLFSGTMNSSEFPMPPEAVPDELVNAGGVQPLVSCVRYGCSRLKLVSAFALALLAMQRGVMPAAIYEKGAVLPLVKLAAGKQHLAQNENCANVATGQEYAALALRTLLWSNIPSKVSALDAGAVSTLLEIVKGSQFRDSGRRDATGALNILCCNEPSVKQAIVEAGGVEVLLRFACETGVAEAALALYRIAQQHDLKLVVLAAGGLMAAMCVWKKSSLHHGDERVYSRKCATLALSSLSYEQSCRQALVDAGGVEAFSWALTLAEAEHASLKLEALKVLHNLALTTAFHPALIAAGVPAVLKHTLNDDKAPPDGRRFCATALGSLALSCGEARAAVTDVGTSDVFLGLLSLGDEAAKCSGLEALSDLTRHEQQRAHIARKGGIRLLLQLLVPYRAPEVPERTRELAAMTLHHLTLSEETHAVFEAAGALKLLTALLAEDAARPGSLVAARAAGALGNLGCESDAIKRAIALKGGLEPLVRLAARGAGYGAEMASGALRNLSCHGESIREQNNQVLILQAGGVPALIRVLLEGSEKAQENAAMTLWGLAQQDANIPLMLDAGVLAPLVHVAVNGTALSQEIAAAGLSLFACQSPSCRPALVAAGAVSALTRLQQRATLKLGRQNVALALRLLVGVGSVVDSDARDERPPAAAETEAEAEAVVLGSWVSTSTDDVDGVLMPVVEAELVQVDHESDHDVVIVAVPGY